MTSGTSLNELSNTTTETARSRCRKPRVTYKSPSAGDSCIIGSSARHIAGSSPSCFGHGSPSPQATRQVKTGIRSKKRPTFSLLPLYHPLGRLALSLPPLDLASVDADPFSRHRPLRDEGVPLLLRGSTFEDDTREKVNTSSRKRRNGGVPRRKRKDTDDGDAAYPRKRNRVAKVVGNRNRAGDEESSTESVVQVREVTPTTVDEVEDKQSERRSRRSKGTLKRRGSSTSDDAPIEDAKGGVETDTGQLDGEAESTQI